MKTSCRVSPKRRLRCGYSRSVLLIIFWKAFMTIHVFSILPISKFDTHFGNQILSDITFCLIYLSFPFFGLLADVKLGRYTTIFTGVYLSFMAWIIGGFEIIIDVSFSLKPLYFSFRSISFLFGFIGYCSIQSNIVQYNIDQTVGASADELSAIIYWDLLCAQIVHSIISIGYCLIDESKMAVVLYILSGVAASTVIISNFYFKHWLDTTHHRTNPVKIIAEVLNFARKNKYPKNRSALTYWEENYPSQLDLGKEKYGGPFSEDEVENVKTILRLIPLFVCIVGGCCAEDNRQNMASYHTVQNSDYISCFLLNNSANFLVTSFLLLLYQIVIYPCFCKYIPSMLKRVGLGLAFALSTLVSHLIMLVLKEYFKIECSLCESIIPQVLLAISYILIFPTSFEFTIAQSPQEMRGFMIGLWFASTGLGFALNRAIDYPFTRKEYFYLCKCIIVLVIFILFQVLAYRYKLRVRENEINVHLIAEEHFERYIEQEVEYRREMGLSMTLESTD